MEKSGKRIVSIKVVLCILVVSFFFLSLLPLLYVARYDLPFGDDMMFYKESAKTWNETGNLGAVFQVAVETTRSGYVNWQGTYFPIFMLCFQPAVFSLSLYSLTPWIMLLLLIASSLFTGYVILIRYLQLNAIDWILIVFTALLFQIQLLPDIKEGFFWYNTALLYTASYCYALFLVGFLMLSLIVKSSLGRLASLLAAAIFVVAVAGGAVSLILPMLFLVLSIFLRDVVKRNKRGIISTGFILILMIVGSVINLSAPGNAIRIAFEHDYYGSHGLSALDAIMQSVINGALFTAKHTDFAMIVFLGVWIASFHRLLNKMKIRFYHPAIVFILTFGLFCMQFTPMLFSLASIGPPRIQNVIFFSLYWFWAGNVFNTVGWIHQKKKVSLYLPLTNDPIEKGVLNWNVFARKAILILTVFFSFCAFIQRDGGLYANPSVQALSELHSGISKEHYEQRLAELQGDSINEVSVESKILP